MTTATHTKADWKLWHEERQRFKARETEGFILDIQALKAHIAALQRIAPKDGAGWMSLSAISLVNQLQTDYQKAYDYLKSVGKDLMTH